MPKAMVIISILAVTSLANFEMVGASPQDQFANYAETTVLVVDKNREAMNCLFAKLVNLTAKDNDNNAIYQTTVGSQVKLEASIANQCGTESLASILIFEVRDPDGKTNYLAYQNTTLAPLENRITSVSWLAPVVPGEYVVRAFAPSCITCPNPLAEVLTYKIAVIA